MHYTSYPLNSVSLLAFIMFFFLIDFLLLFTTGVSMICYVFSISSCLASHYLGNCFLDSSAMQSIDTHQGYLYVTGCDCSINQPVYGEGFPDFFLKFSDSTISRVLSTVIWPRKTCLSSLLPDTDKYLSVSFIITNYFSFLLFVLCVRRTIIK